MGCVSSTPTKEAPKAKPAPVRQANVAATPAKREPDSPDAGLLGTHEPIRFLGRGGTGDTWLYNDRLTGEEVAIKFVKRPIPKILQPNLLREIRIQADLGEGHVNIIQAKEALLTDQHLALVLEFAAGGSLTNFVTDKWQDAQKQGGLFCSENEARYFFRQFISAVDYCHQHSVAHRDLKLDNTLLSNDSPPLIKLCDFGFAREWEADALMYTHIGTPVYMAPELIHSTSGGYDGKQVDVWASGILLVVMLIGQFPYDHIRHPDPNSTEAHHEVWEQQTAQGWEQIPHIQNVIGSLTPEVKDLLTRIFKTDEAHRITIPQIKEHPWFTKDLEANFSDAQRKIDSMQGELDNYTTNRRIHNVLLKKRNDELQKMLDMAAIRPAKGTAPSNTPRMRIDLHESQILDNPTTYTADNPNEMGPVILEDEEGELRAQQSNLKALMQSQASRKKI